MKKLLVLLLMSSIVATGCNDKEKREKALKSLEKNQQLKLDFESQIEGAKNRINALEQQLAVAEDKINRVKEYQLLRTEQERDQQIKDAVAEKQKIEADLAETRTRQQALTDSLKVVAIRIQTAKDIIAD